MPIIGCFNVRENSENYPVQEMFMTAFYRIYRRQKYVSLSEAVVEIQSNRTMIPAGLRKMSRHVNKPTTQVDTLVFK